MGTHRSRHNKGRKPVYKDYRERTDWKRDPSRPAGARIDRLGDEVSDRIWHTFLSHVSTMSASDAAKLPEMPSRIAFMKKRRRDPEFNRRAQAAMANRNLISRQLAPDAWSGFISRLPTMNLSQLCAVDGMPSLAAVYKRKRIDADFRRQIEEVRFVAAQRLSYPYIIKRRDDHSTLMEVNALIPKTVTDDRRADMCQEIILALLEGRTTMDQLRSRCDDTKFFIKKFWRDNFEMSGHAVSLDAQIGDQTWFEVASSAAAKEWHYGQINDRRSARDALATFHAPTQIEDTFVGQVRRKWISMQEGSLVSGDMHDMISFDEVYDLMEAS